MLHRRQLSTNDPTRHAFMPFNLVRLHDSHAKSNDRIRKRAATKRSHENHGPQQLGPFIRLVYNLLSSIHSNHVDRYLYSSFWQNINPQQSVSNLFPARNLLNINDLFFIPDQLFILES